MNTSKNALNAVSSFIIAPVATLISVVVLLIFPITAGMAADKPDMVDMAFIKQRLERLPKLSNLTPPPKDDGVLGGDQGIKDSNATGRFLGQQYALENVILEIEDNLIEHFERLFDQGIRLFIFDTPAQSLLAAADSKRGKQALFFNVGAGEDLLRTGQCRANIAHIVPSYAMRADALAQYLIAKKWTQWFLVVGRRDSDKKFAAAIRNAAKKFRGKIVAEKPWEFGPDMRRTAASTVPVFTQGLEYDVLVVADVVGEFGEYLMYRTWDPRPVVGTQGLMPKTWHFTHEQWGAAQMQKRYRKANKKNMSEQDYGVWAAVRSINTAVTRTQSVLFDDIRSYLLGPKFELAGYKGQKMSLRGYNLQMRQPILLVSPTAVVSVSPQKQFLHEISQLDTLGYDRRETKCNLDGK